MQKVVLVSLDKDLLSLIEEQTDFELVGFLDQSVQAADRNIDNLGDDTAWQNLQKRFPNIKAILAIDPPAKKINLANHYGVSNLSSIICTNAYIDHTAKLGQGVIIQRGVNISRDVHVGDLCKLNINCSLHHDVMLGDYSTIAPGATLLGNVRVGKAAYIGAGSVILPNISIADHVTVGAGAVVTKSITTKQTVVGVPAAPL